jgi:hypothetical protein
LRLFERPKVVSRARGSLSLSNANACPAVQEDLDQPDDVGLVDLDARIEHRTFDDRECNAMQQWKVHVRVEPLGLAGEK